MEQLLPYPRPSILDRIDAMPSSAIWRIALIGNALVWALAIAALVQFA